MVGGHSGARLLAARGVYRLQLVCRSNPESVPALFLQGYIAWKSGDKNSAGNFLSKIAGKKQANKAAGSTAEGDVQVKMHTDVSLLSNFIKSWDGKTGNLDAIFKNLHNHLKR